MGRRKLDAEEKRYPVKVYLYGNEIEALDRARSVPVQRARSGYVRELILRDILGWAGSRSTPGVQPVGKSSADALEPQGGE